MTAHNDIEANTGNASVQVLRIVSGLHAGASRTLADQEMILVGSGEDCDIVLADDGVASHHALISLVGGRFSLRALDAPLHVGTSIVHPGDPVELANVQRVGLGEAALAFGDEEDPAWASLMPDIAGIKAAPARVVTPYLRRLPAVAAIAVLSLASLAIFAAVMPAPEAQVDRRAQLNRLIPEFRIDDGRTALDVDGNVVLSGTVKDAAARQRIRQRLESEDIAAKLELRTGDDIAADVGEVLRSDGLTAKTRYLGNGDVEVSGHFNDEAALRTAVLSRAMRDVKGVNRVIPRNFAQPQEMTSATTAAAASLPAQARIVSIVRGNAPHAIAADGKQYPVGAELPGIGTLISISESSAYALRADGQLQKLKVEPVTQAEKAFAKVESKASPQRM